MLLSQTWVSPGFKVRTGFRLRTQKMIRFPGECQQTSWFQPWFSFVDRERISQPSIVKVLRLWFALVSKSKWTASIRRIHRIHRIHRLQQVHGLGIQGVLRAEGVAARQPGGFLRRSFWESAASDAPAPPLRCSRKTRGNGGSDVGKMRGRTWKTAQHRGK